MHAWSKTCSFIMFCKSKFPKKSKEVNDLH